MTIIEDKELTPEEAFAALRGLFMPFLISGGEEPWQRRFSIAGAEPFRVLKTVREETTVWDRRTNKVRSFKDPFEASSFIIRTHEIEKPAGLPFAGGGVGFFAYDLKGLLEPERSGQKRRTATDDPAKAGLCVPDCVVGFYDTLYIYDHILKRGLILSLHLFSEGSAAVKEALLRCTPPKLPSFRAGGSISLYSNFTRDEYIEGIKRAKDYIASGDIYQINLSQRFMVPYEGDPFALYLKLPKAPFSSFMDLGGFQIISNTPERLLKVERGFAEISPIKGTRPRGATPKEDMLLIKELKESVKERAEHVMIVDLVRNDLGRVSEPGTVEVSSFESIKTFPGLHHMVSTIRGRLCKGVDAPLCLKAVFPGGSVTGAPKIRAMEIIDELEPTPRSIYTGAIGWMGFDGSMDMSMVIRTAVYRDGNIYLHAGGGIVADSDPEEEYEETVLKARGFLDVLLPSDAAKTSGVRA